MLNKTENCLKTQNKVNLKVYGLNKDRSFEIFYWRFLSRISCRLKIIALFQYNYDLWHTINLNLCNDQWISKSILSYF